MKITSFNPHIATAHSDDIIKLFEDLGFEKSHEKEGIEIENSDNKVFRMKDANGYYLDIIQDGALPTDNAGIRINVDDFDEAYELLASRGFEKYKEGTIDTPSSRFALLRSPSGFVISLVQHIK